MSGKPDWKPTRRIKDPDALHVKLLLEPECRLCTRRATDPHHLIFRSHSGDDLPDNVIPVCRYHHDKLHAEDEGARRALGSMLERREIMYVLMKLGGTAGRDHLRRRYFVDL